MKGFKNDERGITILALIITVIVLLILAGIILGSLTVKNNTIKTAREVKDSAEVASEKTIVAKASNSAATRNNRGLITKDGLEKSLKHLNQSNVEVKEFGYSFIVKFIDTNRSYLVDEYGNATYIEGALISANPILNKRPSKNITVEVFLITTVDVNEVTIETVISDNKENEPTAYDSLSFTKDSEGNIWRGNVEIKDKEDGDYYIFAKATVDGEEFKNTFGPYVISNLIQKKLISDARLLKTKYIYDGTEKTPDAIVKSENKVLTKDIDYTITYENNVAIGTGKAIITGIGDYEGTIIRTFKIEGEKYQVAFNSNGGTGTMRNQIIVSGIATNLNENAFTRTDYDFKGWNTKADGSGTNYADKANISVITSDLTLYAQWREDAAYFKESQYNSCLTDVKSESNIKRFEKYTGNDSDVETLISNGTAKKIDDKSTHRNIYAWYDNGTIYWWSDARKTYMLDKSKKLFYYLRAATYIDVTGIDTSKVTDFSSMFYYTGYDASSFEIRGLNTFNTSNAKNMYQMFGYTGYKATTWNIGDLSSWNTSSVTNMQSMFYTAGYKATTFDIGNIGSWNTSSVTSMVEMFSRAGYNAKTWNIGDLSNWNTSSVTSMEKIFNQAGHSATTWNIGDLSNWNTSSVTNMLYIFAGAGYSATTWNIGDLSNWNTSSVTDMCRMFNCAGYSATTWNIGDLSSWNTSSVTDMSGLFWEAGYKATTWNIGDLSNWDTSSVTTMSQMFNCAGSSAATWNIGDLSNWNTSSVTVMANMFSLAGYKATTFDIGDLTNWDTAKVTNMSYMFYSAGYSATTWNIGDLSNWNTSSVTNMLYIFAGAGYSATTWNIGDLSNWNTSSVTTMNSMFRDAGYKATTFDVGNIGSWNTSKVTDFAAMFYDTGYNATTWNIGDLTNWDTAKVTKMSSMFYSAGYSITTWNVGDLSNWDTAKVTDMRRMFASVGYNATTWNIGDLSNWNTSSVTDMESMFEQAGYSATTWNIGDLSNWDTAKVTDMRRMFASAGYNATTWNDIGTIKVYVERYISYMFYGCKNAKATLNIYSNPGDIPGVFEGAATVAGSGITVNYSSTTTLVDNIISTKSYDSNVTKGSQLD